MLKADLNALVKYDGKVWRVIDVSMKGTQIELYDLQRERIRNGRLYKHVVFCVPENEIEIIKEEDHAEG